MPVAVAERGSLQGILPGGDARKAIAAEVVGLGDLARAHHGESWGHGGGGYLAQVLGGTLA